MSHVQQDQAPTSSEVRLVRLLSRGQSIPQIARALGVSRSSVVRRLAELRERYGAANNIHLAAIAARRGWLW